MSYSVFTEDESNRPVHFTRELSSFFQGKFGYEADSEAEQIEQLLQLDFSMFYELSDPDEQAVPNYISGSEFLRVIEEFISKLETYPDITAKMRLREITDDHNRMLAQIQREFMEAVKEKNFEKGMEIAKRLGEMNKLPPDTGYIKKGNLLKDLKELYRGVGNMVSQGNERLKLYYL